MDPTRRFSSRVENYVRYRPGYPAGVLEIMRERCGLGRDDIVADVGSGTGALARLFLENGNKVFGVEPNPEMRRAGEELLAGYEGFTSVDGVAGATTLPDGSADFVTAGQAFHWFDPGPTREEFVRLLRPGGWAVLVWNERRNRGTGFSAAYEKLLERHGTDYARVNHRGRGSSEEIKRFFAPAPVEEVASDNAQTFDLAGLRGRLLSSSYVPAEGEPGSTRMLADLEDLFRHYGSDDRVTLRYDTRLYIGKLSPG